ncbi:peroxisomal membrane anchor protein conserved region-domain-containing protein [Powellomyces hirtus]|nr:peroxisomal membrane anchor protein conserved region-domain-containing protein [Powellomyces hirtus]
MQDYSETKIEEDGSTSKPSAEENGPVQDGPPPVNAPPNPSQPKPPQQQASGPNSVPANEGSQHRPGFSLSPEQREKIKQQLLARQRAARETTLGATYEKNPPGSLPTSHPLGEKTNSAAAAAPSQQALMDSAVTFLRSPSVQNSSWDKKHAFLKQKGLTEDQIAMAAKQAGIQTVGIPTGIESFSAPNVVTHQPSSLGSAPYVPYVPYQRPAPSGELRRETLKNVVLALFLTGGLFTAFVSLLKRYYIPSRARFEGILKAFTLKQQNMVAAFMERVIKLGNLYTLRTKTASESTEISGDAEGPTLPSAIKKAIDTTNAGIRSLSQELNMHSQALSRHKDPEHDPHPVQSVRKAMDDLMQVVSQEMYVSPSMYNFYSSFVKPDGMIPTGVSEASSKWMEKVAEVKSEIRTFKGMLLNRRNFPTA